MSLDVYLEGVPTKPIELYWANITHNLCPMWREAGVCDALYDSAGKKAKEIIPILEQGAALMAADPTRFEALNSSNGWGLYKHALPWLQAYLAACRENPDATIRVSR